MNCNEAIQSITSIQKAKNHETLPRITPFLEENMHYRWASASCDLPGMKKRVRIIDC